MSLYTVHLHGNGSTGYARDVVTASTLAYAKVLLRRFARGTDAQPEHGPEADPPAWADVYAYDERDTVDMTHGDYPLRRFVVGPRGGVNQQQV